VIEGPDARRGVSRPLPIPSGSFSPKLSRHLSRLRCLGLRRSPLLCCEDIGRQIDSGVQAIASSGGIFVCDLHTNGVLIAQYGDTSPDWSPIDSGVQAIASNGGDSIYEFFTNGTILFRSGF
jgi:hypothetical protein